LAGVIASSVPVGNGSMSWIVGQLENGSYITGANLKIRIRSTDGSFLAVREIK